MKGRYIVIADDFTGANDTGIQFLKAGLPASVILDPKALASVGEQGVAVVDTESRNIPPSEATAVLESVAKELMAHRGKRVVYKKVDSTLRGHIALETEVLRRALDFPVTAFTPAFPKNKRTVIDGQLLLDGVPVAETEMGRDPHSPVTTSSLRDTLRGDSDLSVHPLSLEEVRGGRIPALLKELGNRGAFTFDTETEEDLRLIVNGLTAAMPPEEILWVGSAGLAEALVTRRSPLLFVVGSLSPRSALQARKLLEARDVIALGVHIQALLQDGEGEEARLKTAIVEGLRRGKTVLLASSLEEEQIAAGRRAGASEAICAALASVVSKVFQSALPSGLFVTGGEVAIWIVRALGAGGTDLVEEIEPGIPLVRLRGGGFHGLPVVTKAGAFGVEDTMINCYEALLGRQ